jgi:hypothetical protein
VSDSLCLASIYRIHGVTFWESAKTLSEKIEVDGVGIPTRVTAIPFYFLASHAAELLLKSALLKRGFSERDLKHFNYRHSLQGLLDALQEKGVSVTPATTAMISGLHDQHSTHALRYTALVDDEQPTFMPPMGLVFEMLEELLMLTRISIQGV